MKFVSIYNEKGGSAKSTMTVFLSSYLASRGARVLVLDFDAPTYHIASIRDQEMAFLSDPKSPLSVYLAANGRLKVDILRVAANKGGVYEIGSILEYIGVLKADDNYDYVLFDFPGRLSNTEPVSILANNGFIDFVAVPVDADSQCRKSGLICADALKRAGVNVVLFWNKVHQREEKAASDRYAAAQKIFEDNGLEVMPERVRDIRKFSRDSDERLFVRSTLCFPEKYINHWCPSLLEFLAALKTRIDSI